MKKYELPTYSVSVTVPARVAIPDISFPTTVEALYTFGEAVEGEAIVTFYKYEWSWDRPVYIDEPMYMEGPSAVGPVEEPDFVDEPAEGGAKSARSSPYYGWGGGWGGGSQIKKVLFTKTIQINSNAETFDVSIVGNLGVTSETNLNVEVVFTEKLTGKTVSAIGNIQIAQYAYELILTGSDNYVAGTPYTLNIAARRIGQGAPVSEIT